MPTAPEKSPAAAAAGDYATLRELYRPHIESFDYFLDEGLDKMLLSIRPMEITDPSSNATLRNILRASLNFLYGYLLFSSNAVAMF
jgi:DNA-directed RNA polymerase I subunit RPA2